jgi:hypothetical protein
VVKVSASDLAKVHSSISSLVSLYRSPRLHGVPHVRNALGELLIFAIYEADTSGVSSRKKPINVGGKKS